jgi:uncharacterized membrane protein
MTVLPWWALEFFACECRKRSATGTRIARFVPANSTPTGKEQAMKGLLTGAAIGAGLMYAFDPREGRRRRALFLDQLNHLGNCTADGLDKATRDLQNRIRGTLAEVSALASSERTSDDVIAQRVRSKAGRFLRHPAALEVDVSDGCVCLRGPVLRDEHEAIVSAARWVRGVRHVDDQLEVHDTPDIAALQGEGRHRGASFGGRSNWSPATRLVAGSIGGMLLFNCLLGRSVAGTLGGLAGFGLLARALSNVDAGQALGISDGRRGIDIHKTIEIGAPVERVFDFFADPTNYPRISDVITRVQMHEGGHFTKDMTIGGQTVQMHERITCSERPECLESQSDPGSVISYFKQFRFEQADKNRTRIHLLFSYNPPGGVMAHAAAALAGYDPKAMLDDLMMRAKAFLETGKAPHDAADKSAPKQTTSLSVPVHSPRELRDPAARETPWPQPSPQVPPVS